MIISKKYIIIFTIIILLQSIISYFIFRELKKTENKNINLDLTNKIQILIQELKIFYQEIKLINSFSVGIFQNYGKYLPPETYNNYINQLQFTNFVKLDFQRWIPRISHQERPLYESFGNQYIRNNFSIIDIRRNGNIFTFTNSPNRSFYYPFTLSVPPFIFTPLGGDFMIDDAGTFIQGFSRLSLTLTNRVNLVRLNSTNTQNYGTFLYNPVFPIGYNISSPNETDIIGFTQLVFVFSDIINGLIRETKQINNFDYFLLDLDVNKNESITSKSLVFNNQNRLFTVSDIENIVREHQFTVSEKFSLENKNYQFIAIFFEKSIDRNFFPESMLILSILIFIIIDMIVIIALYIYNVNIKNTQSEIYRNLLGYINHEIRNLLNGVIGNTEILKITFEDVNKFIDSSNNQNNQNNQNIVVFPSNLYNDMKNGIENISNNTIILSQIVNDTINSKITSLNFQIHNNIIKLSKLAIFIKTLVQIQLEQKPHINYKIELFDENYVFYSDQSRIIQILINFILNSIKFTDTGEIIFRVEKEIQTNNLVFKIIDTGCGIDKKIQKYIFTKKIKEILSKNHYYSGSGIGLYFSKIIAKDINGVIGFTSTLGHGSTFWLSFDPKYITEPSHQKIDLTNS
jgi:signal transduction histidine kinase